ncbi:peroxide stress protein YaaA [Gemella sp. 19428wG2_WT2a]|nr:peroxide stress protein YaaA [Gemella sp. 19428wG2_WT2a]TFU59988.1 peroxide stress protein YaaA [Gemella sp. WT2a]
MKILIPTAKEMSTKSKSKSGKDLGNISRGILQELRKLDSQSLAKLYKIKEDQAEKEVRRWQEIANKTAKSYSALNLFDGLMYRNIKREILTETEREYFIKNVFITSSFYGIINVFDEISEHRLDFLQNIKVEDNSLKKLWRPEYDLFLEGEDFIISLLSNEFEEVFSKEIRNKFIKVIFMEEKAGVRKSHSTISKKARGKFLTYLVKNNIESFEEIKKIKFENYKLERNLSTDRQLVFVAQVGK